MTSKPWQSFYTNVSVDVKTLTPSPSSLMLQNSIVSTSVADRTDLYPFKIVDLQWLVDQNLMTKSNPFDTTDGQYLTFFQNSFTSTSPYLPIGDPVVLSTGINAIDLTQIPVVLILNDPLFAQPVVSKQLVGEPIISPKNGIPCTSPYYYFNPYVTFPNFVSMGSYFSTDSTFRGAGVLVNANFVSPISQQPKPYHDKYIGKGGQGFPWVLNVSPCNTAMVWLSGPYSSFQITEVGSPWDDKAWNLFPGYNPFAQNLMVPVKYNDIIPAKCLINYAQNLSNPPFNYAITPNTNISEALVSQLCTGPMLNSDGCYKYCSSNNCDTVLNNYCNLNKSATFIGDGLTTSYDIPFSYLF